MAEKKLARRYANSLLGLAVERGTEEAVFADMALVARACTESRDLSLFLKNPVIHTDKKDSVLRALFRDKLSELSFAFMEVITRKRRERYLEEIADEFVLLYKVKKGIATAVITSAAPLDQALQSEVTAFLAGRTHCKIELTQKKDPAIIGGYILRWGDEQVDASISRKLRELRRSFEPNLYIKDF